MSTTIPSVDPLPTPPTRSDDEDTFAGRADDLVAALIPMVLQINAALAAIPAIAMAVNYNTISSSAVAVGTGTKSFTAETGKLLQPGQFVIAASASGVANYMAGQVLSYDPATGALSLTVATIGGSGSHSDWIIAVTPVGNLSALATVATTGSGADLNAGSITYDRIQNVSATQKLLGRGSTGAGVMQEIALGSGLSIVAGVLTVSTGTATLADGDYGDVVVSGGGTGLTIDAAAVTYPKIQNVSGTDKLLGRSTAGAGTIEEIPCTAAGRALLVAADAATQRTTLGLGSISTFAEASVANFRAATAGKALSADKVWSAVDYVTLAQASTIAVDLNAGINFTTTMTGNRTLGDPTNAKKGQAGVIEFIQGTTGNWTNGYGTNWKFAAGITPVLSKAIGAKDYLFYEVISPTFILAFLVKDAK